MTAKKIIELLDKLIPHYKAVIEEVGRCETVRDACEVLLKTCTNRGICFCSSEIFEEEIGDYAWVKKFQTYKHDYDYWAKVPIQASTVPEMISLLQLRIDIMENIYQETKESHLNPTP